MYKNSKRDKHKHSHSRYAKHEVKKEVIETVLEETKSTSKFNEFLRTQKQVHAIEAEEKHKQIDQALKAKNDANAELNSEKNKVKQLKEELKVQSKKMKQEKKHFSQEKKNLKRVKKKNNDLTSFILVTIFTTISALLFFTVIWLFHTWPNLKMDELVYQLNAPTEGTSSEVYLQYFLLAGVPTIIWIGLIVLLFIFLSKCANKTRRIGKNIIIVLSIILLVVSGTWFDTKVGAISYLENKNTDSTFIKENYVDPTTVELTFPKEKRNVITIYCESMEITYSEINQGGGFENNLIPNLTKLSEENDNFSNSNDTLNGAISLTGSTWTMGGLFATSSGLPLILDIDGNGMETQSSFFPSTTVLGDILEENGYNNVLSIGSNATFGGRALYFETHGNYDIRDIYYRKENKQLDEDYYVFWGFEDQKLFEFAKEDLEELSQEDQPFNYTMLTVDTHPAEGYFCDLCEDIHDGNQYANVISCSDKQISEFIEWAQQQDWYENTTIVITGDHPTMNGGFCESVSDDYQRKVYTTYINADPIENVSKEYREYSTFDTFPTTLAAMGVSIEGDKLGLGTNLYSGVKTLVEEYGVEVINSELSKKSDFMSRKAGVVMGGSNGTSVELHVQSYNSESITLICENVYGYSGSLVRLEAICFNDKEEMNYIGGGKYCITVPVIDDNIDARINVVSLDENDEEVNETIFDYTGNPFLMDDSSLINYLNGVEQLDLSSYTIFAISNGDATKYLSEEEQAALGRIGAGNIASSNGKASIAVMNKNESYSKASENYLEQSLVVDDISCFLSSSTKEEHTSEIIIGDEKIEYSENGLCFVVWDNVCDEIISQCSFESNEYYPSATVNLSAYRLKNDVEVSLDNVENFDDVISVVAVLNDDEDSTEIVEKEMQMNADGTYVITFEGIKNKMNSKTISIYAVNSERKRILLGEITSK